MSQLSSGALVFFGATGDMADKKIFPALQSMAKRAGLNVPVIGIANAGWNLVLFNARVHDSPEKKDGVDPAVFKTLCGLPRYVDGNHENPSTFSALREALGSAHRPARYLAIPPTLFGLVVEEFGKSE
jgi:glucose-6-phosphate 1-dehydrogenase